jgi:hypothetical protein
MDLLLKRFTRARVAAVETTAEPGNALFRCAVCEPIGSDTAAGHALEPVVAD